LSDVTTLVREEAETLVEGLVHDRSFDAVAQLARHLPVKVVSQLVGVPEEGRERMLDWANASFNAMGPMNDRTRAAIKVQEEMLEYAHTKAVPPHLTPGGWAQMLYDAGERGDVPAELCPVMIPDYLAPSLDTTIHAIGNAVVLFAQNPDQWSAVRADRSLMTNAINEVLRVESPVQKFTRFVTRETVLGGCPLPEDSRVLVMYASANRDERRWTDPERFDVRREGLSGHLAFGSGPHACIGQHLARIEMKALFEALAERVERFDIVSARRNLNQTLRGYEEIRVEVLPA
jgi:cytochrome P450